MKKNRQNWRMRDPQTKTKTKKHNWNQNQTNQTNQNPKQKKAKPPPKKNGPITSCFGLGCASEQKKYESPVFDTMHSKENIKETSTKNLVNLGPKRKKTFSSVIPTFSDNKWSTFCGPISDYLDRDVLLLNISLGQFVFCSLSLSLSISNFQMNQSGIRDSAYSSLREDGRAIRWKKQKTHLKKKQQKSWLTYHWKLQPKIVGDNFTHIL